ncbi:TonB-dependent receptor plug domain-containing protein [Chryseobacterium scophthalmum]|uniref:TonB-dependent receptor plug domain-containing protein n=1 Tax=Chryseobacterium scophthalmum TaxID=59733 RepID=UPI003D02ADFF
MKIILPKPCHEKWESMTQQEKGRFCAVCSKTVRDFTNNSDDEILDYFSDHSSQNICGNFYESQLNRNMQYSIINSIFSKFAIGFILTAGGIVAVNAQESDPVMTLALASLQGKISCLTINQNNAYSSPPIMGRGAPSSIQGNNEPLWVIDGEIMEAKTLKDFDPNKIKKMNIIKGIQATALYGTKARNGVVIIKLKKEFRKKK